MKSTADTLLLRIALSVIMVMHGVTSFIDMSVIGFGKGYLAQVGFGVFGLPLAFAVKLIHVFSIYALLANRFIKFISIANIIIFIAGIIMIHGKEGWYVVGGGSNGVEYNFLLIFCFATLLLPGGVKSLFRQK